MKHTVALVGALMAVSALGGVEPVDWVDPFIGTSGTGHTHPSATCPFAMLQAGPTTGDEGWENCSGYRHEATSILGYSLTHLSGTGCLDAGDVRMLPFTGEIRPLPMRAAIDKRSERATPGYYHVVQDEDGIEVRITATERAALYRLKMLKEGPMRILLDLPSAHGCPFTSDAAVTTEKSARVFGQYRRYGWIQNRIIAFDFRFSREWSDLRELPRRSSSSAPRMVLTFPCKRGETLFVKVGLSMTDAAHAASNLEAEIPAWDFDGVRSAARAKWNALLGRATCEGTDDQKRIWYTAAYHMYVQPNDYSDHGEKPYYTTLSLWDTFRATHAWYTLATPEIVEPTIDSMLRLGREIGRLPVMSYGGKNMDCMIGNHAVPVIADAYLKGFRGFDVQEAARMVVNTLRENHPGKPKEDWEIYDQLGYFPYDLIRGESCSRTLEGCYDDWCAAKFLERLGQQEQAEFFRRRSQNWRNIFDRSIGFARGKDSCGNWRHPYTPYALGHGATSDNDFTEGNAFQYSWHVMQDPFGLVEAMGGRDEFVRRLDSLFAVASRDERTGAVPPDVTGLIGQYAHGNEPSHHVLYFYPLVGEPRKAADRIREVCEKLYGIGPDGLCGNDDCGQMSAWYVFAAMGFYPFNPCGGEYVLGAPQVPMAEVKIGGEGRERTFRVVAKNLSKSNKYVKTVTLNGKPLTDKVIRHADILRGGELVFEMGE